MTMTLTATETYTRADVCKVFERFGADYRLAARSTGLVSLEEAEAIADDVAAFAAADFLIAAHIVLRNAKGAIVRAEEYVVTKEASGLTGSRPGGCIWEPVPGGSLVVVVNQSHTWRAQSQQQQARFLGQLRKKWGASNIDTDYPGLLRIPNRDYVSNAFGLRRSSLVGSGA